MATDQAKKKATFLVSYALQSLGIVLLLSLLIRVFAVSSYVMSGVGMIPTVWPGDFVLGLKGGLKDVKRGAVVALRCPGDRDQVCMKRVVGVAGDRIEFAKGQLLINGKDPKEKEISADFNQEFVGGRRWVVWAAKSDLAATEAIVVPPGSVFLLNDKRADLEDSRSWGVIALDQLQARVAWIWLSLEWSDGENVLTWPRVRWSRILRSID